MTGRSADDLRFLVLAGAGLDISAQNLSEIEVRYLAMTAAQHQLKPKIVLRDVGKFSTDQLRRLATAGKGCLVFADLEVIPTPETEGGEPAIPASLMPPGLR